MSEFPYTDEQVRQFTKAREYPAGRGATDDVSRDILECCHRAGITVTFPRPRYYVRPMTSSTRGWEVYDRLAAGVVAAFWHYEDARAHAVEYADSLNRQEAQA